MGISRIVFFTVAVVGIGLGSLALCQRLRSMTQTVAPIVEQIPSEDAQMDSALSKSRDTRIRRLFSKGQDRLPVVETITYSSRTPWVTGRATWPVDYANHYQTSTHFIARSLHGKPDYEIKNIANGEKFNVFREEANIGFYLLVSIADLTMDFYCLDYDNNTRIFLTSYPVSLGRIEPSSPSGTLTPLGKYTLGSKICTYKPGIEQIYRNTTTEMIQVFGTRWLPFAEEIEGCTDQAKGYGLHGVPCYFDEDLDKLIEHNNAHIGAYNSDGCIHLSKEHIEELYAIIAAHTEKTEIEIVECKEDARPPLSRELEL